jgi:hypothetical protein
MTYCGTLGRYYFALFSDLILRKMTEGSLGTDPRASDMASAPKHRLFPSSTKLLSTWASLRNEGLCRR